MITVTFLNGCILATAEQSLWQYSYNQQLQIVGLELPEVFTVDFCNEGDTTTVAMIGSSGVVDIPNELLTSGRDIVAYVFQKSALTGGITRCEIRIGVLTRPERDDETPTPEQEAVIDQYIAELNEGVEKANESAEDAEAWAVGERGGEPVSESDPTYENNAKYWAENISGQLEDYRTAADQDAIDSAQDGKINALTNLLNKKQSKITANGILKGDGNGGISAAVPGMDYLPTSALYAYRSAIKQDEIDNAQNANIAKNADDIADVKTTADTALQPAALAPYRTAADQDAIDNAQAADIAAINDKIPSTASKNNKLVAWSTFNGQLGTKQAKITANGILKGDGAGGVSAAVAGTDYLAPSALDAYRTAAAQDEIDAAQDEDIADVKAAVDQKAPIIINSASGDIASFDDGAEDMPIKQLTVNVEPIQAGSGDPSPDNVRPISGRTSATVTRTGRNLLDMSNTTHNNYNIGSIPNTLKPNTEYTFSVNGTTPRKYRLYLAKSSDPLNAVTPLHSGYFGAGEHISFTTPNDMSDFDLLCLAGSANGAGNEELSSILPQLELGSTASAYHPYQGNTYTIQLGDTVYGGTLDVTNGVLTVTMAMVDMGSIDYVFTPSGAFRNNIGAKPVTDNNQHGLTSIYPFAGTRFTNLMPDKTWMVDADGRFFVKDSSYNSASAFKTAMNGQTLCYELATPIEITLTPTQIETLLGTNNIWSDAGTVDVDYCADTKLYIQNIHQPTEDDMTADAQIASGKYFLIGGNLYKSTTVIPAGDTIIPGTNCIKTNLAEALNALNA